MDQDRQAKCVSCGGELEVGFLPDVGHAQTWVSVWVAGAPSTQSSFWQKLRTGGGVRLDGVRAKAVDAMRCTGCGRLELYANRDPEPESTLAR